MTFRQIWDQLVRKDADLARGDARIEITSDNLQQLLKQVYEQGVKAGNAKAKDPFDIFGKL